MLPERQELHQMIDSIPTQSLDHARLYLEFLLTRIQDHQQSVEKKEFNPLDFFGASQITNIEEKIKSIRDEWER